MSAPVASTTSATRSTSNSPSSRNSSSILNQLDEMDRRIEARLNAVLSPNHDDDIEPVESHETDDAPSRDETIVYSYETAVIEEERLRNESNEATIEYNRLYDAFKASEDRFDRATDLEEKNRIASTVASDRAILDEADKKCIEIDAIYDKMKKEVIRLKEIEDKKNEEKRKSEKLIEDEKKRYEAEKKRKEAAKRQRKHDEQKKREEDEARRRASGRDRAPPLPLPREPRSRSPSFHRRRASSRSRSPRRTPYVTTEIIPPSVEDRSRSDRPPSSPKMSFSLSELASIGEAIVNRDTEKARKLITSKTKTRDDDDDEVDTSKYPSEEDEDDRKIREQRQQQRRDELKRRKQQQEREQAELDKKEKDDILKKKRQSQRDKKLAKIFNVATDTFDECEYSFEKAAEKWEAKYGMEISYESLCEDCGTRIYDHTVERDMPKKPRKTSMKDDYKKKTDYSSEDPDGEKSKSDGMEKESSLDEEEKRLKQKRKKEDEDEYVPTSSSTSSSPSSGSQSSDRSSTPEVTKELVKLQRDEIESMKNEMALMKKQLNAKKSVTLMKEKRRKSELSDYEKSEDESKEKKKKSKTKSRKSSRKSASEKEDSDDDPDSKSAAAKKRVVVPSSASKTGAFTYERRVSKKKDDTDDEGSDADSDSDHKDDKKSSKKKHSSKSKRSYSKPTDSDSSDSSSDDSDDSDDSEDDSDDEPIDPSKVVAQSKPCARYVEELLKKGCAWGTKCKYCKNIVDQHQRQPGPLLVEMKGNGNGNGNGNGLVKDAFLYPRFGEKRDPEKRIYDVPVEFLMQFEITASLAGLDDKARTRMLILRIDNAADRQWCQFRFGTKNYAWKKVRKLFEEKFTPVSQKQQAINNIVKMKQRDKENVKRFISRFNQKLFLAGRTPDSLDDRDKQDFEAALKADVYEELVDLKRTKGLLGAEDTPLTAIQKLAEEAERNILLVRHSHRNASKDDKASKEGDDDDNEDNTDSSKKKKRKRKKKAAKKEGESDKTKSKKKDKQQKKKDKTSDSSQDSDEMDEDDEDESEEETTPVKTEKTDAKTKTEGGKQCNYCKRTNHNTDECFFILGKKAAKAGAAANVNQVTAPPLLPPIRSGAMPYVDPNANTTDTTGLQPNNSGTMKDQRRYQGQNDFRANPNDPTQIAKWQRLQTTQCYGCGQFGHIAAMCPNKGSPMALQYQKQRQYNQSQNNNNHSNNIPQNQSNMNVKSSSGPPQRPPAQPRVAQIKTSTNSDDDNGNDDNAVYDSNGVKVGMISTTTDTMVNEVRQLMNNVKKRQREAKIVVNLVNGGTRNYSVLMDTGSEISTVRPEIVKELGMAITPPEKLQYLGMADPTHQVKRIGTVELLLEVKFLSGQRKDIMMEKEFEVMNGSYDFLFGVDVIPELYPEYSSFFLSDMFDRRTDPLLAPPRIFTEEERQHVNLLKETKNDTIMIVDGHDYLDKNTVHVCIIELTGNERDDDEEALALYDDGVIPGRIRTTINAMTNVTMPFGSVTSPTDWLRAREEETKIKTDEIGPANLADTAPIIEQLKQGLIPMEKDVYLDDAFQTIRNQLLEDGIGVELSTQLPDKPEASTPAEKEELYKKQRARIEKKIKPLIEMSEKCVGYCTHPMSKISIEMKKDIDINELAQAQYKVGYSLWSAVTENIIRWLEKEKVEPGDNACKVNNPLLPVPRKDEKGTLTAVRTCLDLRKHNLLLITDDKFELPNIPEMLRALGQKSIFAELDLSEAFTQFEVLKVSRKYLTFRWMGHCFQFRCMPFGWKPAPGVFQRFIITILADLPFAHAFIDNISIASDSFEEHEKHVEAVIKRLLKWNLKLKPGATKLCHSQLKILGHLINREGIGMDPTKVVTIKTWEQPKDVANLRAFLGFAGFLSDHVRHFADIAAPLYEVKNKTGDLVWTTKMIESFNLLKKAIVKAPWLKHPDFTKPFVLATDASAVGVGCVLYQPEPDDPDMKMTAHNIVGIYSHKFTESQRRFSTYKKELYAIVMGLQRFHQYLFLKKFTVITDHKPLEYLLTNKNIPVSLQQWTDILLNYNFTIKHRPGVLHVIPDALSRMYENAYDEDSTWGVGTRERLNEVAEKILPPSDKVDKKTFEDNLMLSAAEVERRDRKLLKQQTEVQDKIEVMMIQVEEDTSNNEIVMSLQQLRDDSVHAGPLLCSVTAHYGIEDVNLYNEIKNAMKGIKTHDDDKNEIIETVCQSKDIYNIAANVQAIESRDTNDNDNKKDESSSSTDNNAMDIQRNAVYDKDDKQHESTVNKKRKGKLTIEEKLILVMEKKGLTLPPESERRAMIEKQHEKNHFGRDQTYQAIMRDGYWWPRLRRDVEDVVADCDRCLAYTVTKKRYHPARHVTARRPGDQYAIDILTLPMSRKGYSKLLVLIDICTRFGVFWPLKNESAEEIARVLLRIFSFLGPCKILQSDNGPSLVSDVMKAFCNLLRIHQRFVTEYHPEANGIVERPNDTITQMVRKFLEGDSADWPEIMPYLQIVYNDHIARDTGLSMFFLMLGREMNEFQDYRGERPLDPDDIDNTIETTRKNWERMISVIYPALYLRRQEESGKQMKKLDEMRKLVLADPLPIGTLVMVRDHRWIMTPTSKPKLTSIYYPSKYRIISNDHGVYKLQSVDDGQILDRRCTIDMLKRITGPTINERYKETTEEDSYEVEEICDMKTENGVLYYLLKWKGYDELTWEPASQVTAPLVVRRWQKKQEDLYKQLNDDDEEKAITKKRLQLIEKEERLAEERQRLRQDKDKEYEASESDDMRRLARRRRKFIEAVPIEEERETDREKAARLERRLRRENKSGKEVVADEMMIDTNQS